MSGIIFTTSRATLLACQSSVSRATPSQPSHANDQKWITGGTHSATASSVIRPPSPKNRTSDAESHATSWRMPVVVLHLAGLVPFAAVTSSEDGLTSFGLEHTAIGQPT